VGFKGTHAVRKRGKDRETGKIVRGKNTKLGRIQHRKKGLTRKKLIIQPLRTVTSILQFKHSPTRTPNSSGRGPRLGKFVGTEKGKAELLPQT